MSLVFYGHPFSSYCQKVLIALYENTTPFSWRRLDGTDATVGAEFAAHWPLQRMPILLDSGQPVMEASIIIEHLDVAHPGANRFVPSDPAAALQVRFMDRVFDNYIATPMQRIVFDTRRPPAARDPQTVTEARALLDQSYDWLETRLNADWSSGNTFSLADCAAAPALFYSDWVHPIGAARPRLTAYRRRLLERPSFARAVNEARPYRHLFPPGAPNRD